MDYDLVTPGRTDEDAYLNAKLSISIARKMGATIWLVFYFSDQVLLRFGLELTFSVIGCCLRILSACEPVLLQPSLVV